MSRTAIALSLGLLLTPALHEGARAQGAPPVAVTEEEARAIATDAYVYLYPLVTMDITRRQATNVEAGKEFGKGPMNMFVNVPSFPSADMRAVVRVNFDTLYSIAWLDLTKEPFVVSSPEMGERYHLLPMLDMWTDVFASPGTRTTGNKAGNFLVTPPGWSGTVPEGMVRISAPTPYVWVIGRTKTDGPPDYEAVHKVQAGYKATALSDWGKVSRPAEFKADPSVDMKTPPKTQMDAMPGDKFFAYAAELMKLHPPHLTDQPIVARMRRIGMAPGQSLEFARQPEAVRKAIEAAPAAAHRLMAWKLPTIARVANHWSMNTDTMGVYGNFYLKRAIIAQQGLGANLPEDAIYPLNLGDSAGRPLDGANRYVLLFEKGEAPPADAFWSVTLYDADGFQVANPINRFAVSSWMPFQYGADGSLDLIVQSESPGKDREANWLPAPKGPFNLTMRIYSPRSEALTGKWNPPPVTRVDAFPGIVLQ